MPAPQLALPQQFGRFLLIGALVFALLFWALSTVLMSNQDVHRDIAALVALSKSLIHQPFANWIQDVETAYIPFFLRQHLLLACYSISFALAWLAAFLYDIKILRKENIL